MRYQLHSHSLAGGRATNQDRVAVAERDNAVLLVVADGLGGHAGGELAAETLVQTFVRAFRAVKSREITRPSAFLALAILQAHNTIRRLGREHRPPLDPRTTCVACLVQDGYAYWAHVGDSRLYHFRAGQLRTRTQDHTNIEQMRGAGLLTEREMQDHPDKSRLLNCLGGPNKPNITLSEETPLMRDDVLLACTDGVWEALTPEELIHDLKRDDLEEAVEEILLGAQRKRGRLCDNVSAAALRWQDAETHALARQGNIGSVQVDSERLLKDAQRWITRNRAQEKHAKPVRKNGIEAEIEEMERYLRNLEPKSPRP
jgi:serine/threonine protein phosphatase PrpC